MDPPMIGHVEVVNARLRRLRARRVWWAGWGLVLFSALFTFRQPLIHGNFGVVDPGLVYRSAQPKGNLPGLIRAYRLASILNLRGGSFTDPWYASEVRLTRENSVVFFDLPLGATRRPTRRELILLLDLLQRAPYPLLIHCKSGSDRTGLAAALYLVSQRGVPPDQALSAFSLHYGHFALGGTEHLHEPLLEYSSWLKSHQLSHSPARFRNWVEKVYRADDRATEIPPLRPGPRAMRG